MFVRVTPDAPCHRHGDAFPCPPPRLQCCTSPHDRAHPLPTLTFCSCLQCPGTSPSESLVVPTYEFSASGVAAPGTAQTP